MFSVLKWDNISLFTSFQRDNWERSKMCFNISPRSVLNPDPLQLEATSLSAVPQLMVSYQRAVLPDWEIF